MSRTRIIGGNLSEKVAGDYKVYSNAGIVNQAQETVTQTGHSGGVALGSPDKRNFGFILSKCLVNFRPGKNYPNNPSFGFDWIRTGDTQFDGDNPFFDNVGKVYNTEGELDVDGNFKREDGEYAKLIQFFKKYSVFWENQSNPPQPKSIFLILPNLTPYCIPILSILKDESADLQIKLEIKEAPSKIELKFDDPKAEKFLQLSMKEITDIRANQLYDLSQELTITCTDTFNTEQRLVVYADDLECGSLVILPNAEKFIKVVDVAFIKVKTNINSVTTYNPKTSRVDTKKIVKIGSVPPGGITLFNQIMQQALLKPNVTINTIDCTNELDDFVTRQDFPVKILIEDGGGQKLKDFLNDKVDNDPDLEIPKNAIRMYFFDEEALPANSFSYPGSNWGVMFQGQRKTTITHETLHCMGLPHTFDPKSKSAKFTYKKDSTSNVMDYASIRNCLFAWQWKTVNSNINV